MCHEKRDAGIFGWHTEDSDATVNVAGSGILALGLSTAHSHTLITASVITAGNVVNGIIGTHTYIGRYLKHTHWAFSECGVGFELMKADNRAKFRMKLAKRHVLNVTF